MSVACFVCIQLCDDMVAELSSRGGLSSTTQALCQSTDSVDLPQADEPSLQTLLAGYVQAVAAEEEEPNKEEVTAVRGRSKVRKTLPNRDRRSISQREMPYIYT